MLAAWASWRAIRNQPVIFIQLIAAGVIEALIVIQGVIAAAAQFSGRVIADPVTLWGYILTCLVLLPIAAAWALVDRTRTSSIAMVVITVCLVVCYWRIWQVWVA